MENSFLPYSQLNGVPQESKLATYMVSKKESTKETQFTNCGGHLTFLTGDILGSAVECLDTAGWFDQLNSFLVVMRPLSMKLPRNYFCNIRVVHIVEMLYCGFPTYSVIWCTIPHHLHSCSRSLLAQKW